MNSKIISVVKYFLLLAIGILLLWLTFRHENLKEIFTKIEHANFFYVSIGCLLGLFAFIVRAHRWNMLLEPLGYNPKLINSSAALGLGYFANLAIPRIGEITRCGVLSKSENIPFEKLIGTVIVERIIDVVMLLFSILLVASLEYQLLSEFLIDKIILPMKEKTESDSSSSQLILFLIAFIFVAGLVFILKSKKTAGLKAKIFKLFFGVIDGLKTVVTMKKKGTFLFYTLLMWFFYFLSAYVCFSALDATAHLGANEGLFVLVSGGLGMAAPVQGGIGAYHYIVSQSLLLFNIALTDGITYATLVHTSQTLLVIVLGCISLFVAFRDKKNKKAN